MFTPPLFHLPPSLKDILQQAVNPTPAEPPKTDQSVRYDFLAEGVWKSAYGQAANHMAAALEETNIQHRGEGSGFLASGFVIEPDGWHWSRNPFFIHRDALPRAEEHYMRAFSVTHQKKNSQGYLIPSEIDMMTAMLKYDGDNTTYRVLHYKHHNYGMDTRVHKDIRVINDKVCEFRDFAREVMDWVKEKAPAHAAPLQRAVQNQMMKLK